MYGDTENAADILAAGLAEAGVKNVAVYDISNTHVSTLIAESFRCSHLVIASPTYNGGIYPATLTLLHDMKALNLQNRTIGLIENGTWAPTSTKQVRTLLEEMKNMQILEPAVTIKSALKGDSMEQHSGIPPKRFPINKKHPGTLFSDRMPGCFFRNLFHLIHLLHDLFCLPVL